MDAELECAEVLAVVERRMRSLRAVLESRRWSTPRGLLHALCLGVLRNYRLLVRLLRRCGYRGPVRGGRREGWLPIVAAYEAVFRRGRVPAERLERFLPRSVAECLRSSEPRDALDPSMGVAERLSVLYSVPRWVVEKLLELHDATRVESILRAFQEQTPIYIRFNRSLVEPGEALRAAQSAGVEAEPDPVLDDVLVARRVEPGAVERLDPRLFYIQDRSAALVAHVLGPVEGLVFDPFSAPGGKASHVLWRNPGATVAAMDSSRRRLGDEARLLARQGVLSRVLLIHGDARRPPLRAADAAIVDPDCSSIGRIGHSPETRLFLEQSGPRIVERMARLQREGLRAAAKLLPRGAVLVYSTCTLTREENEGVVQALVEEGLVEPLESGPWIGERSPILPRAQRVYPDRARCSGGFVARLRRV